VLAGNAAQVSFECTKTCGVFGRSSASQVASSAVDFHRYFEPFVVGGLGLRFLLDLGNIPVDAIGLPPAVNEIARTTVSLGFSSEIVVFRDRQLTCLHAKLFMIGVLMVWLIQC